MNKNIRWLQYSIGLILLIISLISFFNYKVDSSGIFGHSNYLSKAAKALTSGKMVAGLQNIDDRLFQELIIRNLRVRNDVIAIGSSTTMHLRKGVISKDRINFFNHSLNGASLEDYIAIVGAYEVMHDYLPSTVILGVDPWVFNKNNGQGRWTGLKQYHDYELDKIYGEGLNSRSNSNVTINTIKWKQLINFDYTVSNIKFIIRALLKNESNNPPLPLKEIENTEIVETLIKSNLEKLSDRELILKAIGSGNYNKIEFGGPQALDPNVPSYEKELANREELIEALEGLSEALLEPKQEKFLTSYAQAFTKGQKMLHNDYINSLVGFGILGLLALLALLFFPLIIFFRRLKAEKECARSATGVLFIIALLVFAITDSIYSHNVMRSFFVFFLGVLLPVARKEYV